MALGPSGRRNEPLHVIAMALALAFAAFLGAALGLVWHASGFGEQTPPADAAAQQPD
jgi:hypothetical protein